MTALFIALGGVSLGALVMLLARHRADRQIDRQRLNRAAEAFEEEGARLRLMGRVR